MSLYDKMTAAWANRDGQAYLDLHHEDFQMTWHSTGRVSKKGDTSAEQMSAIMGFSTIRNRRCIFESDDIIVQHMFADYENGTKDATLHVTLKKDGLLWRTETGVTAVKTQA